MTSRRGVEMVCIEKGHLAEAHDDDEAGDRRIAKVNGFGHPGSFRFPLACAAAAHRATPRRPGREPAVQRAVDDAARDRHYAMPRSDRRSAHSSARRAPLTAANMRNTKRSGLSPDSPARRRRTAAGAPRATAVRCRAPRPGPGTFGAQGSCSGCASGRPGSWPTGRSCAPAHRCSGQRPSVLAAARPQRRVERVQLRRPQLRKWRAHKRVPWRW